MRRYARPIAWSLVALLVVSGIGLTVPMWRSTVNQRLSRWMRPRSSRAAEALQAYEQGEWERAAAMQDQSEYLRSVLDEAREAARRAHEADSLASGGEGVEPQDVQEEGSGNASGEAEGADSADGADADADEADDGHNERT